MSNDREKKIKKQFNEENEAEVSLELLHEIEKQKRAERTRNKKKQKNKKDYLYDRYY